MLRLPFTHKRPLETVKTTVVATAGLVKPTAKSPEEKYKDIFEHVQGQQVYQDSKTFVDMVPRTKKSALMKEYAEAIKDPNFDVKDFVNKHFVEHEADEDAEYTPTDAANAREHVKKLWPQLIRKNRKDRGSLIALPHPYLVPGGRFREQFYWDSYFAMLGLAADGLWETIEGMMKNYVHMITKYRLIPTANRTYLITRSQPPYFSAMVRLLAKHKGRLTYVEYLPALLLEYRFWMKGRRTVSDIANAQAMARVVRMPDGVILNRYYDNKATPRPEALYEDTETAGAAVEDDKDKIFLDLRAGAESGWDFSSRWFRDNFDIQSIHTTDIVPIDLNCLLYQLEQTIAEAYTQLKQPLLAKPYRRRAEQRAEEIRRSMWDQRLKYFTDYDFRTGKSTGKLTVAGVFPLFAKIASSEQADAVAKRIETEFLREGGLLTTLQTTGQQWDAPNGWAPLQWIAIQGLREYGYFELANTIRDRWLEANEFVFNRDKKMVEKYDVVDPHKPATGGEYVLQDGFGWTNGVYAVLKDEQGRR